MSILDRLFRRRWPWIAGIVALLLLYALAGCANAPVSRSTDTPAYSMRATK